MLDHGADVNAYDKYTGALGQQLSAALSCKWPSTLIPRKRWRGLLVERGAKLNRKDSYGNTELHLAALKGYARLARILLRTAPMSTPSTNHSRTAFIMRPSTAIAASLMY